MAHCVVIVVVIRVLEVARGGRQKQLICIGLSTEHELRQNWVLNTEN